MVTSLAMFRRTRVTVVLWFHVKVVCAFMLASFVLPFDGRVVRRGCCGFLAGVVT